MTLKQKFVAYDQKWRAELSKNRGNPGWKKSAERHAWWIDHGMLRFIYHNNFEIAKGVFRSNQPSPAKIEYWFSKGVRTVLNLRGESDQGAFFLEQEACKRFGIKLINHQLAASTLKPKEILLELCHIFKNIKSPMLIHCKSGSDRAGIASAIYLLVAKKVHPTIAAKQLSIKYLHLKWYRTGVLDYMINQYAKSFEAKEIDFETWLKTEYDPEFLLSNFFKDRGNWSIRQP